jgi:hypothetical protein
MAPLEDNQLLAEGQVLQSNFSNTAGQDEKANQRTEQRKHEFRVMTSES